VETWGAPAPGGLVDLLQKGQTLLGTDEFEAIARFLGLSTRETEVVHWILQTR
jgi:hypothetical protein